MVSQCLHSRGGARAARDRNSSIKDRDDTGAGYSKAI